MCLASHGQGESTLAIRPSDTHKSTLGNLQDLRLGYTLVEVGRTKLLLYVYRVGWRNQLPRELCKVVNEKSHVLGNCERL